ncbi:MAG TPA: rhamnulokinase family protein [Actinomycetes bacterium]
MVRVAAVDLGASSGRVMVADVGRDHLSLRAVARFGNDPVRLPDGLHWNAVELFRQSLAGLRAAAADVGSAGLASIGVDSWAVDYALVRGGRVIGPPFHYRDEGRATGVDAVHEVVPAELLYERNGLQFLPFNTLYQLAADPLVELADHALLIPDLIGYWLTGRMVTERTNASTTGLLDVRTQDWDVDLCGRLGVPTGLFPELVDPGATIGRILPDVADAIGVPGLTVTAVGSHDTASAVVGVPMSGEEAAYISCGTWGLVGVELDKPVVTAASRAANFTNEGGVDGRTRFLTNVMGTWLISETVRTWERSGSGGTVDLARLLGEAAEFSGRPTLFDVQDPRFLPPGDMPSRIAAYCAEHALEPPEGRPAVIASIVHSLAAGFARAVEQAAALSGRRVTTVHVVGGGVQNTLLCQSIADHTQRTVLAGPVEATALGNVLVQARALGAVTGDLDSLRRLIARTHDLATYLPSGQSEGLVR